MNKKCKGDTRYGYLVRNIDGMHRAMPLMMGKRTENEAVASFDIPAQPLDEYLAKKNAEKPEDMPKYTYLHAIAAAVGRVVEIRPMMNRYIKRYRYYDRKDITLAFTAKKQLVDGAEEAIVVAKYKGDADRPSIDIIHDTICRQVKEIRKNNVGTSDKILDLLNKLPFWIIRLFLSVMLNMDAKDKLPKDINNSLPFGSTCFITNLGSIKMNANYHHLVNFGSNSFFMIIGAKYKKPEFHDDGTFTLKEVIPVSVTIDERIADGIYFGNSLRLLKGLLLNPQLLDKNASEKIDLAAYISDKV